MMRGRRAPITDRSQRRRAARLLTIALVAGTVWLICPSQRASADVLSWSAPVQVAAAPWVEQPNLADPTCPTAGLCLIIARNNEILASTDPSGGDSSWRVVAQLPASVIIGRLACASVNWCLAIGETGQSYVSSTPATGGFHRIAGAALIDYYGVFSPLSCPRAGRCFLLSNYGALFWLAHGQWHQTNLEVQAKDDADWSSIGCQGGVCAVEGSYMGSGTPVGLVSADPTGSPNAWTLIHARQASWNPRRTACLTDRLCLINDDHGDLVASRPISGHNLASAELANVQSCAGPRVCVDVNQIVEESDKPFSGPSGWHDSNPQAAGTPILSQPSTATTITTQSSVPADNTAPSGIKTEGNYACPPATEANGPTGC